MKIIEATPLMIFLGYLRIIDTQIPENWKMPFLVSGCAATFIIAFSVYKKTLMDRILLGFNLYFITGGVALITHQWWLNNFYDQLHASGLLLWVIIIGLITAFLSSYGFIGVKSSDAKSIRKYSYYLLFFSIIAFSISFIFREDRVLSELVPFIGLFVLQGVLKEKVSKNSINDKSNL
ncbi:MAG: hypothetical protein GY834_07440 [Bacteroidetes bacterium]|nr:hypothetical protein [Bacteroidota bacterium]